MPPPIVTADKLKKSFGNFTAVNDVSFSIQEGECVGLLGPNGAGKSTLISMIYGASPRTSGELEVFGLDPAVDYRSIKQRLGIVPQENALDTNLTVKENLDVFFTLQRISKTNREKLQSELLKFMLLDHKLNVPVLALSGGMMRRLVFVRALLAQPRLLILDEPTTGLDPAVRQLLWTKIEELKSQGTSIILTTHYMDEAEQLCDRLIIMDHGNIKEQGRPKELIKAHCPGFVAIVDDKSGNIVAQLRDKNIKYQPIHKKLAIYQNSMDDIHEFCQKLECEPHLIRPTNLEDVFLDITGRGLSSDA